MVAAEEPAAPVALAAGPAGRLGGLAEQELGDAFGERQLADTLHAVDEERVRQPRRARRDRAEDRFVPGMHQSSPSSMDSALWIAATSRLASMTRTRAGSALARARYAARTRSKKARSSRSKRSSFLPEAARRRLATS